MTRDSGDHGDRRAARATALCLRPSATTPPPHNIFVENKDQTSIRPNGDRAVEAFFSAFSSGSIWPNFSLVFSFLLFGRQRVATWKGLGFLANC
jgi:hypothetical protein